MSWNASRSVEELRTEFLDRWAQGGVPVTELCREYGISRKTAYKWKGRERDGNGLGDRSRRPKSAPNATPPDMVSRIVALRSEHPTLGGAKIAIMLRNEGVVGVSSGSTVTGILRRRNMLDERAVAEAKHLVRFAKSRPNEMWQMDFKGHFLLDSGRRCHPLNVIDDYSRYAVISEPLLSERFDAVRPCLVAAFRKNGLPDSILCDNGAPWGVSGTKGISALEAWAMELDVLILHGCPLHPQTQGKEERFNKTWKREALGGLRPEPSQTEVRTATESFLEFYNNERPHFGIGGKRPCELYRKSERAYPERIADWDYPGDCEVKYVNCKGYVSMDGERVYVGEGLRGKRIAMRPSSTHPGCVSLLFRNFRIGRLNVASKATESPHVYRLEGDPRQSQGSASPK